MSWGDIFITSLALGAGYVWGRCTVYMSNPVDMRRPSFGEISKRYVVYLRPANWIYIEEIRRWLDIDDPKGMIRGLTTDEEKDCAIIDEIVFKHRSQQLGDEGITLVDRLEI